MSETAGMATTNSPYSAHRMGTIGEAVLKT